MGISIVAALILLPILFGAAAYFAGKKSAWAAQAAALAGTLVSVVLSFVLYSLCREGLTVSIGGFAGGAFSFTLDRFRGLYCMIISLSWLSSGLFGVQYFQKSRHMNRFWFFFMLTLTGMFGVFLSGDLVSVFVFFEVMSFASFVWVIHEENEKAFHAAGVYLAVTVISGMCLLMGLFLLANAVGTLSFSDLAAAVQASPEKGKIFASGILMLVGFGAKAGAFPIHIWLPKAHSASPAPASALLSGILTKAGIFGLIAVTVNLFPGNVGWGRILMGIGYITMLLGGVRGIFSSELKETLAWSSVSQLGFITIGCALVGLMGERGGIAASGTVLYMLNHSVVKIVLFLCAGVVVANLHKMNLNEIKGFGRGHPGFMLLFLSGALSLCGIPPFAGYAGKTLLHESILEYGKMAAETGVFFPVKTAEIFFLIGGGCTVAYMTKLFVVLFLEKPAIPEIGKRSVLTPLSAVSISVPAAALLLFGVFADRLRSLSSGCLSFFGVLFGESVRFFSLSNLSGALISVSIGAVAFFLIVRLLICRKDKLGTCYRSLWPAQLDLETCFYRPAGKVIGWVFTALCKIVYSLPDFLIFVFYEGFLAPSKPKEQPETGDSFAHLVGASVDRILSFGDRHIFHKNPEKRDLELRLAKAHTAFSKTTRKIILNFSFALLMACIGICLTLLYILFFSR